MTKRLILLLCLHLSPMLAFAQSTPAADMPVAAAQSEEAEAPPTQILVTGKLPGPGLWKISRGDHVLWVFGTYSPLPQKAEWRVRDVEKAVAQSQEYIMPPGATTGVGFLRSLTVLPFLIGFKNNPDGKELKDVLPADVYARWLPLKEKYLGDDSGIERERPVFASSELYKSALQKAGLANGQEVRKKIEEIVKKNKIRMTRTLIETELKDPGKALREFKKSEMDDTACFARTIERLETDIEAMRVRANAWATGDIEVIQKLTYPDREEACTAAFMSSSVAKNQPELKTMLDRSREAWLASAEKALAANTSTFAILSLNEILNPKGLVAALQAKGYTVEKPE